MLLVDCWYIVELSVEVFVDCSVLSYSNLVAFLDIAAVDRDFGLDTYAAH